MTRQLNRVFFYRSIHLIGEVREVRFQSASPGIFRPLPTVTPAASKGLSMLTSNNYALAFDGVNDIVRANQVVGTGPEWQLFRSWLLSSRRDFQNNAGVLVDQIFFDPSTMSKSGPSRIPNTIDALGAAYIEFFQQGLTIPIGGSVDLNFTIAIPGEPVYRLLTARGLASCQSQVTLTQMYIRPTPS